MDTDVKLIHDFTSEDGVRCLSVETCAIVCSSRIDIEVASDRIQSVKFTDGCNGNTQGVAALCRGMKVSEAISRLEGINCKGRGTSCPDQLAKALREIKEAQ